LDICNFMTVDFIYSVYPCPFDTTMGSIFITVIFLYSI